MSHSRKKVAGWCDSDPITKRKFNRSIRRKFNQAKLVEDEEGIIDTTFDLSNGKSYKKINCSYDICDWKTLWYTENEYKHWIADFRKLYPKVHEPYEWFKQTMK